VVVATVAQSWRSMSDPRRLIPGVDRLLEHPGSHALVARFGRARVADALRAAVDDARRAFPEPGAGAGDAPGDVATPGDAGPYIEMARAALEAADVPSLRRVLNATGVLLHTNLGRAPLATEARTAMAEAGVAYTNLEFDLSEGARGSRYVHCASLLAEVTRAESALVVNNCAAALVLAVNTLAAGRGVAVSRGELVEIGGGFRIPDMLARAGARLIEVGTTNRTRPEDYSAAFEQDDIGLLLKVHRSNFRLSGFTEEASLDDLVALGRARHVPVLHDVGSGLLVDAASLGLPAEPRASESVAAGATLAAFSGDKLLGGPQAGCIVGSGDVVRALRANPLCRALRVDKGTLAALEATLRLYGDPDTVRERVPVLRMLTTSATAVQKRAETLAARWRGAGIEAQPEAGEAVVGGGTFPGHTIASWTVRVPGPAERSAESLARALRLGEPAVVGRIEADALVLDLRTVHPDEDDVLAQAVLTAAAAPRPHA
jgi:L-seryl-tRNA(Ser) seleniumtransferase